METGEKEARERRERGAGGREIEAERLVTGEIGRLKEGERRSEREMYERDFGAGREIFGARVARSVPVRVVNVGPTLLLQLE